MHNEPAPSRYGGWDNSKGDTLSRRFSILAGFVAGLFAVGGIAVVTASSASAATTYTPTVLIDAPTHGVNSQAVTYRAGVEFNSNTEYLYGETLVLQRQYRGSSTWISVKTAVANSEGVATFTTTAVRNSYYRVTFAGGTVTDSSGTVTLTSAKSSSKYLSVGHKVTDGGAKKHHKIWLHTRVTPGWGKHYVYLQKASCAKCAYHSTKRLKTNKYGIAKVKIKKSGYYRFYVKGNYAYAASVSPHYYHVWYTHGRTALRTAR